MCACDCKERIRKDVNCLSAVSDFIFLSAILVLHYFEAVLVLKLYKESIVLSGATVVTFSLLILTVLTVFSTIIPL